MYPILVFEPNIKGGAPVRFPVIIYNNGDVVINETHVYKRQFPELTKNEWFLDLLSRPKNNFRIQHPRTEMPIQFYYLRGTDRDAKKKNSVYLYGIPSQTGVNLLEDKKRTLPRQVVQLYFLVKNLRKTANNYLPDIFLNRSDHSLESSVQDYLHSFPSVFR